MFLASRPFNLASGTAIQLRVSASGLSPTLRLYDPSDVLIAEVEGTGSPSVAVITHTATVSGLHLVTVTADSAGDVQLSLNCGVEACAANVHVALDQQVVYSTVCSLTPGPFQFVSENDVLAIEVVSLYDHFPLEEEWDTDCPLGWNDSRTDREHTAGPLVLGPYGTDVTLFAATDLFVDDLLTINDEEVLVLGGQICKNTVLLTLPQGDTATIQCWEKGGAWAFAAGYIGVTDQPECLGDADCDPEPDGWCELGNTLAIENLVPEMTSNSTPSGTATASGEVGGDSAWKAMDRNNGTEWTSNADTNVWLLYQFPEGKTITRYIFDGLADGGGNYDYVLESSIDGSSWDTLDSGTTNSGADTVLASPSTAIYFRLSITQSGATSFSVPTFELLGPRTICDHCDPTLTFEENPGGGPVPVSCSTCCDTLASLEVGQDMLAIPTAAESCFGVTENTTLAIDGKTFDVTLDDPGNWEGSAGSRNGVPFIITRIS